MAEGFSPLPNKGLIILEKYTCVLQKELRQPWKLCLSLEAGGFGTLDDYYQCYSQTSFTSPAMQAHHLLNGIRMAVHRDPNSLLKFLDAMESCSLCGGVAGKMKEEYNSHTELCHQPFPTNAKDDPWPDIFKPSEGRLNRLLGAIKTEIRKANITPRQIKRLPLLASLMHDKWEQEHSLDTVLGIIFKHCSPFNHSILLPLVDFFQLTDALKAMQAYEKVQQHYSREIASLKFIDELKKYSRSLYRDMNTISICLGFPLTRISNMTVSEFKLGVSRIFSYFSCFLHITGVSLGPTAVITLCAPQKMSDCLLSRGLVSRHSVKMIGATLITIGDNEIFKEDTASEQMIFEHRHSTALMVNPKMPNESHQMMNDYNGEQIKNFDTNPNGDSTTGQKNIKSSSLEDSQSETITDQPVGDRAIARNEGAILRLQDSETQQSLLKVPYCLKPFPIICKPLKETVQQNQSRKRERLHSWRRYPPEPRDVIIIGSFGRLDQCSQRHIVAEKIVPKDIEPNWMEKEVKEIEKLYAKNPDTFVVKKTCRNYRESYSRQDILNIIEEIFRKCEQPGVSIWYTGHGEKDTGNWCFRDGVITFNDIYTLYWTHFGGKSLTIITDCSYSGNWVYNCARKLDTKCIPACGHHVNKEGLLIKIIASCQENQKATALSYITEGVHYDEEEKGVIDCPDDVLKSGQKPMGLDFRNIRCSCLKKEDACIIERRLNWRSYVSGEVVNLIYTICSENERAWHCVLVDKEKVNKLERAIKSSRDVNVSEYGEVLCSGWGSVVPEFLYKELELRFLK